MNRIRELINKRKAEARFKQAGKGHRLVADGQEGSRGQVSSDNAKQLAAEAAMKRMSNVSSNKPQISRTQRSIMEEARRQLQASSLEDQKQEGEKKTQPSEEPKAGTMASMAGVYFTCELVGDDVCMEKRDLMELIENRLRCCLKDEPLLSAALMVVTLNSTVSRKEGIEVMCKYIDNILNNPTETKYRSIRMGNKVFVDKVSTLKGGVEFMLAAGFEKVTVDAAEFLKIPDGNVDVERLQLARDVLVSTEPISIKLHRNPKIFKMTAAECQVSGKDNLSGDFFRLSSQEIRQEQYNKSSELERLTTLRTQAMREKDEARLRSTFRYSLIRVRFPDDWVLQGVFNAHEKLSAVRSFVQQYISCDWIPFHFQVLSEAKFKDASYDMPLSDLHLCPAAMLRFEWDEGVVRDAAAAGRSVPATFLKPELCGSFTEPTA